MARPERPEDFDQSVSEDWVEFVLRHTTMTANKPTTVITRKVDTGEQYTVRILGTDGGSNITLQLKNKNDQIGEDINGKITALTPPEDYYELMPAWTFVSGDTINLVATAKAAQENMSFLIRGHKIDRSGT